MARPIDEKIVAMKMDNSDFKRKAMETTGLFGKLTSSLSRIPSMNLGRLTKDFGGIQRAVGNTDLSGLTRSVDAVASRFSNLGVVATTALATITARATNAATNMWQGLTTRPIMDGFREYETKMGSIQTILANTQSKGTDLSDVKASLEDLNAYADQTIYNFAEMTKNIGLFTNAGLGLEESTSMIKGFSNAAAASGSNAEDAARAAYQLSQGLSSGTIIQQDWMSLTNAGMGNDNMKRDLIAIAQAAGELEDYTPDQVVKDWKNLLTDERWLGSDTMSTYLQAMAGDLTQAQLLAKGLTKEQANILLNNAKVGEEAATKVRTFTQLMSTLKEGIGSSWATSFELIFGDFEEATKLWTGINDIIGPVFEKQGKMRNELLRAIFRDGDGLSNMFGGIKNVLAPIGQLFKAIGSGFRMAFPPTNAKGILSLLESFKELTSTFRLSEGSVNNLKTIFAGFFSIFAIGWKVIQGAVTVFLSLIPSFEGLGAKILELIAMVFKIPLAFNKATDSTTMFEKVLSGLKTAADFVGNVLEAIVGGIIVFAEAIGSAWRILSDGDFSGGPWSEESQIVDKLMTIRKHVVDAVNAIQEAWSILTKGDFTGQGPWAEDSKMVDWLFKAREAISALGEGLSEMNFSLEPIASGFSRFFDALKTGFDWLVNTAKSIGNAIKENMPSGDQLLAGGFITALVGVVGMAMKMTWDWYNIFTNLGGGIGETLEGVGDALGAFAMQMQAQSLLLAAVAVGILAASLWLLADLDLKQIGTGLYAIIGSMGALVGALKILDTFGIVGGGFRVMIQILTLAAAFTILSVALKVISTMDWGEVTRGIFGLVGVLGAFSGAIAIMSKFGGANVGASSIQIIAIAGALLLLTVVIRQIAQIPIGSLVKGLAVITVALAQMALFLKVADGAKFSVSSTIGILALGFAIDNIVRSVEKIAGIDVGALAKGLVVITLILGVVAGFSMLASSTLLQAGVGILLLAGALNLLIIPIATFGNMDLATLAIGLGTIAVALLAIAGASMLMTAGIAGAFAIVVIAGALHLLIIPIATLGSMSWSTILTGVGGLALALGVLGGTAALLGLVAPAMMAFVLVLGVASIAMMLAGVGISLLSVGLVNLAALGSAAVVTIIATLTSLVLGFSTLIPMAIDFIVKVVIHMATALEVNTPILAEKGLNMIVGLLTAIANKIPEFINVAAQIVTNIMDGIAQKAPELALSASNMILSLVEAMTIAVQTNGPAFQAAFMTLMAEVLLLIVQTGVQVIQALFGWIPGVTGATNKIGETAEQTIRDAFGAKQVGDEKGAEFAGGLSSKTGDARNAGSSVAEGAESGANTADLNPIGSGAGVDFASGLGGTSDDARGSGVNIANAGESGAGSVEMSGTGENFGLGFAQGIGSGGVIDSVISAATGLARMAKNAVSKFLDEHSPSKVMEQSGVYFGQGFANGIVNMISTVGQKAKSMASTALDSVNQFVNNFELPEEDNELHFKAVIDYDRLDTANFGRLGVMAIQPDTRLTNGLVSAANARLVQNGNTSPEIVTQVSQGNVSDGPRQPLVVQTMLNGRVIAEEIIDDISKIQNDQQQTLDRARGVY